MNDVEKIKKALPVEQLVSEYVPLKRMGKYLKACCPFHNEKTPSFIVNAEIDRWHCFGCAKGGDIFTFVQDIDGIDFAEALRLLASKAGVVLSGPQQNETNKNQKNRLKDVLIEAARFFHGVLTKMEAGKTAQAYLAERGVHTDTIRDWQIGYAPEQWDLLTKYLLSKGQAIDDIVAAGLTIQREGANQRTGKGYYDRFRDRVMFPIRDVHGAVVGFTGRVLQETEKSGAKYVNTPQTTVYDKSTVIFGLDKAKHDIRTSGNAVLVEGQMDVIACHQAGMKNVVATSGTALTQQQITLLSRYADTLLMAFDGDSAGQKAAKRGIDLALEAGLNIRVIQIPQGAGKDPDECLKNNPDIWFQSVKSAADIMKWYLDIALAGKDLTHPKEKMAVTNAVLPEIKRLPSVVEQDHWLRELSGQTGIDISVLQQEMSRMPSVSVDRIASQQNPDVPTPKVKKSSQSRLVYMVELLLAILVTQPKTFEVVSVQDAWFHASPDQPLYETLKIAYSEGKQFASDPRYAERAQVLSLLLVHEYADITPEALNVEAKRLAEQIATEWGKVGRLRLQRAIAQAEAQGDTEKIHHLLREYQALL